MSDVSESIGNQMSEFPALRICAISNCNAESKKNVNERSTIRKKTRMLCCSIFLFVCCVPVDGVSEAGVIGVQLSSVGQDLIGKPATRRWDGPVVTCDILVKA